MAHSESYLRKRKEYAMLIDKRIKNPHPVPTVEPIKKRIKNAETAGEAARSASSRPSPKKAEVKKAPAKKKKAADTLPVEEK